MKRRVPASLLVLALAACTPPAKRTTSDDLKSQELAIAMAVGVQETTQLKVGQWALYSVRTEGSTASLSTRIAVVAADSGTFWIENRTLAPVGAGGRQQIMVSKYQIDGAAKPLQLWVGEPGTTTPTKVPIGPPKDSAPLPSSKVEIATERIKIAATDKTFDCTRISSKATYPGGRETTLVTWCCKDVPFSAVHEGKLYGGVVRRTYAGHTLELAATGTDAVPELAIPEK